MQPGGRCCADSACEAVQGAAAAAAAAEVSIAAAVEAWARGFEACDTSHAVLAEVCPHSVNDNDAVGLIELYHSLRWLWHSWLLLLLLLHVLGAAAPAWAAVAGQLDRLQVLLHRHFIRLQHSRGHVQLCGYTQSCGHHLMLLTM
jgi:hypothetical protein